MCLHTFCHYRFLKCKSTHLSPLFEANERTLSAQVQLHPLPDTDSLTRLFWLSILASSFTLFSPDSCLYLKVFNVSSNVQSFSAPNFKVHLVPTLWSLPRCSQPKLLFCVPSILYSEFHHIYSSVSLPLLQLKRLWAEENPIHLCIIFPLSQYTSQLLLKWLKIAWRGIIKFNSFTLLCKWCIIETQAGKLSALCIFLPIMSNKSTSFFIHSKSTNPSKILSNTCLHVWLIIQTQPCFTIYKCIVEIM